jgi:phosphatidylserine/phosphatidylglycerophosphate/cardiolipin synthase-like enzyme
MEQVLLTASTAACAFYDLDLQEIKNVVIEKNIPAIIDEDNYFGYGTNDTGNGLMHNKFCTTDTGIISGSFNPTYNDNYKNNNNMLIITSSTLRQNYQQEFDEIDAAPNAREYSRVKYYKRNKVTAVNLSGILVENYFCPEDDCQKHVLTTLQSAKQEIRFMIFSFTDDQIGDLLVSLHAKGLSISGVMDKSQHNDYDEFAKLQSAGIDIQWDHSKGKLHHKVFIIDRSIVITGSYNPTKNGNENNAENILIIHSPEIAQQYLDEYSYVSTMVG